MDLAVPADTNLLSETERIQRLLQLQTKMNLDHEVANLQGIAAVAEMKPRERTIEDITYDSQYQNQLLRNNLKTLLTDREVEKVIPMLDNFEVLQTNKLWGIIFKELSGRDRFQYRAEDFVKDVQNVIARNAQQQILNTADTEKILPEQSFNWAWFRDLADEQRAELRSSFIADLQRELKPFVDPVVVQNTLVNMPWKLLLAVWNGLKIIKFELEFNAIARNTDSLFRKYIDDWYSRMGGDSSDLATHLPSITWGKATVKDGRPSYPKRRLDDRRYYYRLYNGGDRIMVNNQEIDNSIAYNSLPKKVQDRLMKVRSLREFITEIQNKNIAERAAKEQAAKERAAEEQAAKEQAAKEQPPPAPPTNTTNTTGPVEQPKKKRGIFGFGAYADGEEDKGEGKDHLVRYNKKRNTYYTIGAGVPRQTKTTWNQFGRYVIHKPSLQDGYMSIRYPSLAAIVGLPRQKIGNGLATALDDLVDHGKVNPRHIRALSPDDLKLLRTVLRKADVVDVGLGMDEEGDAEMDRFELLKSEIIAGQNSPQSLKELKRFILKFMADGRLSRQEGLSLLGELAILT